MNQEEFIIFHPISTSSRSKTPVLTMARVPSDGQEGSIFSEIFDIFELFLHGDWLGVVWQGMGDEG